MNAGDSGPIDRSLGEVASGAAGGQSSLGEVASGVAGSFAEPRRLDVRGIAVEALGAIRQGASTAGIAAVIALLNGRVVIVVGVAFAVLAVLVVVSVLGWMRRTYSVSDGALIVASGILQRTVTTVPIERVQGVSVDQQLAQRLFGVVRVRIDTAGSGGDEVDLSAVSRQDAVQLREAILAGRATAAEEPGIAASGDVEVDAATGPEPEPVQRLLHRSVNDLLVVGLTRNPLRVAAAALGSLLAFGDDIFSRTTVEEQATDLLPTGPAGVVLAITVVAAILVVVSSLAAVVRYFDLTVDVSGPAEETTFGVRYGLLDKRERTVANRRVQILRTETSPAERVVRRSTVRLASAGARTGTGDDDSAVTLPGSTAEDVARLVRTHLEHPMPNADRTISKAMVWRRTLWLGGAWALAVLAAGAFAAFNDVDLWWLCVPAAVGVVVVVWWHARALWRSWLWTHDGEVVLTRHGVVGRQMVLAQTHKLQTAVLHQGLFERRRALATVRLRSAAGTVEVPYLELPEACRLRDELLAAAEANDRSWM